MPNLLKPFLLSALCWYGCQAPDSSGDESYIIYQGTPFLIKIDAGLEESLVTIKKNERTDSVIYKLAIPTRDTNGLFPETAIQIVRNKLGTTLLEFEMGGTETNIKIVDSMQEIRFRNNQKYIFAKRLDFSYGERSLLDISDLTTGVYYIHYSSCHLGGIYKMIWKDQP